VGIGIYFTTCGLCNKEKIKQIGPGLSEL